MQQFIIDHLDHDLTTVLQSIHPENLQFSLNDEDTSTISYEMSLFALDTDGNDVIQGPNYIGPWRTGWRLRYGPDVVIAAGLHSSMNLTYGGNALKIGGVDWLGYFNRRFMPFDGRVTPGEFGHINDYVIGTPPQGFSYSVVSTDVATILTDLLDTILGRPNSVPVTYSLDPTGIEIDYQLSLADTTTLLSIIQSLSGYTPGTAFRITPGRVFQIASPRWYGDPNLIANDSTDVNLLYHFNESNTPPSALDFINTGPAATHVQGEGQGSTTRNVVSLGNVDNQEFFWRLDAAETFDNTVKRTAVQARTQERLAFDINPVHQISLVVDPFVVDQSTSDGFFWSNFKPGLAIWLDIPLGRGFHHIQSAHHIVSMDCNEQENGNVLVSIGLNQIYDTSGEASTDEG